MNGLFIDQIYIAEDGTHWEREPLERLTTERQLMAHRHGGFWQSMDTLRDVRLLEKLWASGEAPWNVWNSQGALVHEARAA